MTTATDDDAMRSRVHGMWAAVADRWAEHADTVDQRATAITSALLAAVELQPGDAVLELAGGPGGLGLAAAERVGPTGRVLVSDVVPAMVAIAAARAAERGLANVGTAVLDLEAIDRPDVSHDVVLCREGLMFAVDPERAAREVHRVVRPGGRVGISVWGSRSRNPWLGLALDAVTAQTGTPIPPPGVPGPFALADDGRLTGVLAAGGFVHVRVEEVAVPLRAPSFEAWWERTIAVAGPIARIVAGMEPAAREELAERARQAVAPYRVGDALELPGVALVASARRQPSPH